MSCLTGQKKRSPKASYKLLIKTENTTKPKISITVTIAVDIKAPIPALLAAFGLVLFQTKNKIKPTNGMKKT